MKRYRPRNASGTIQ